MVFSTKVLKLVNSAFNPVSHAIFDIDGLLLRTYIDEKVLGSTLKTEDIYYKVDKQIVEKYGKEYFWDVRLKVLGRTEKDAAQIIVDECNLPITTDKFIEEAKKLEHDLLKNAVFCQGAERLVRHLASNNVPIALATSSGTRSVQIKTSNHREVFDLFHHIITGDTEGLKQGKPAPDIYKLCASKFADKPDPSKCLVFEDAPNGVIAAKTAGMQVVMVPEKHISDKDRENATLVLDSLLQFKPEFFGLPEFTD